MTLVDVAVLFALTGVAVVLIAVGIYLRNRLQKPTGLGVIRSLPRLK